jgi:hypothetical protein
LPSTIRLPGPRLIGFRPRAGLEGIAMETFTQLFGDLLAFVYHCFDRIVIYGYLSGLSARAGVALLSPAHREPRAFGCHYASPVRDFRGLPGVPS